MTELGPDSVLGRDSPLVPNVEGRQGESALPPIDDVPPPVVPIALGRFIDVPIVDPVGPPSGEILLVPLPSAPVVDDVEPRLDDVDPTVEELSGDDKVEPVVPTRPNVEPLPGGQLVVDVIGVVCPVGLVMPVGLVNGPVGLVEGPVWLVGEPTGLGGPTGPPTGPGGPVASWLAGPGDAVSEGSDELDCPCAANAVAAHAKTMPLSIGAFINILSSFGLGLSNG
ncbi:MAG: hypothetical protein GEV06_03290 [Luteitalea sp.]|nr:hypothetical protein [Luteitalea sp.]